MEKVLGGHIAKDSTLCTDKDKSYKKFSETNGNPIVQIKGGKESFKGIYHIQHLNSYHSRLKAFIQRFKGVSTKYLNNYIVWNNIVEHMPGNLAEKARLIMGKIVGVLLAETALAVPLRPALPVLVKNQS